eukprot:c26636_g1_i1.p1 GENE.c26636_g1_i1~~c26636_g1_i1.p1  ORF type:complete len:429 (+),score=0.29 c26636_g1_i1:47-1288(+)
MDVNIWLKQKYNQGIKSSTPPFAFCYHPYVLNVVMKTHILEWDTALIMREMGLNAMRMGLGNAFKYLLLRVRRGAELIPDTLVQLMIAPPEDLKKQLRIIFDGEEGVDEGGVQKEFFQLIIHQLFDADKGMFLKEDRFFWFNCDSFESEGEYELIGMVLGLAIYNSVILDLHLPPVTYKKLLGGKPTLFDLTQARPDLGRGLQRLLDFDGDVEDVYCRNFEITYEVFGEIKTVELKSGGSTVALTNDNRYEYVNLYVDYILTTSVAKQFNAFSKGFHKVAGVVKEFFCPEELELVICGSTVIDFVALEKGARYDGGYDKDCEVIKMFWNVLHGFTLEEKKKFLSFTTGSDRVPIEGLESLRLAVVKQGGEGKDRLPTSHTCFNVIMLPPYDSEEQMRERLTKAIQNCIGFGLM